MDIAVALVPSLLFGALSLLLGAFPTDTRRQNTAVMVGAGAVSLGCAALLGAPWSLSATIWGAACGLMWTGGQVFVLRAFRAWGVSRTMPLTTALQLLLNATLGVSLFGEWRAPGALILGMVALALIMLGAAACSWQERTGPGPTPAQRRAGLLATAASAVLYGSYPSLLRAVEVPRPTPSDPWGWDCWPVPDCAPSSCRGARPYEARGSFRPRSPGACGRSVTPSCCARRRLLGWPPASPSPSSASSWPPSVA